MAKLEHKKVPTDRNIRTVQPDNKYWFYKWIKRLQLVPWVYKINRFITIKNFEEMSDVKCKVSDFCPFHPQDNGYCTPHQGHAPAKAKKSPTPIAKVSDKKREEIKAQKPVKDLQNTWFAEIEAKECINGSAKCWNCGETIIQPFFRTAIAHIFAKRKNMFPSVATHPDNYLILGSGCGCHQEFDRSWGDATKMQVWPLALERAKEIIPSIAESEKKNLPIIFN